MPGHDLTADRLAMCSLARISKCPHPGLVPVETLDGERVALLCPDCDGQFDPGFRSAELTPDTTWAPIRRRPPALLLAAVFPALCCFLAACSAAPPDVTVHGTVTYTPVNGVPPAQACPELPGGSGTGIAITPGVTYSPPVTVTITADDGPGNYAGRPWRSVTADMTLISAAPGAVTYAFTAQVPGDGVLYQVLPDCPGPGQALTGESFSLEQLQAGVAVCAGDACPAQ